MRLVNIKELNVISGGLTRNEIHEIGGEVGLCAGAVGGALIGCIGGPAGVFSGFMFGCGAGYIIGAMASIPYALIYGTPNYS